MSDAETLRSLVLTWRLQESLARLGMETARVRRDLPEYRICRGIANTYGGCAEQIEELLNKE